MSASNYFPLNSRYYGLPTATHEMEDERCCPYLTRRFLPLPSKFALLHTRTVTPEERLDNITAQELGDPELFWRICDANGAMKPEDLEVPGRELRITLPEGIPGTPHA